MLRRILDRPHACVFLSRVIFVHQKVQQLNSIPHTSTFLNDTFPHPGPLCITDGTDARDNRGIDHNTCLQVRLMFPFELEDTEEYAISSFTLFA